MLSKCVPCHVSLVTALDLSYGHVVTTTLHSVAARQQHTKVIAKVSL